MPVYDLPAIDSHQASEFVFQERTYPVTVVVFMAEPSDLDVLKERCDNIKEGLKRNTEYVDALQKDVSDLKAARVWLFGVAGALTLVFAGLGFTGAFVFKTLNNQVESLETKASKLQDLFEKKLQSLVDDAKSQLDIHANKLAAALPPVITFLDASKQQRFVENLNHSLVADQWVAKMEVDGVDFDCSTIYHDVPPQAKGAIVQVLIFGTKLAQKNLTFLCADSQGKFGLNRLTNFTNLSSSGGVESYTNTYRPASGVLFCPFLEHSTKFRYRLDSEGISPDREIACQGFIIGWY